MSTYLLLAKVREDLQSDRLERLTVEINKPHPRPFLVSTWYRPPNSLPYLFNEFENLIGKIDSLNLELYLVGSMNTNMIPGAVDVNSPKLSNICDIYSLHQLTTEPTRVTAQSQSLIDICITNTPDKIGRSGVMLLGIGDHSLVYLVRKAHYTNPGGVKIITTRSFKKFDNEEFLKDVEQRQWDAISLFANPNEMWEFWKNQFLDCIDKHAPLKRKRVGNKKSPWITNELVRKMRKGTSLKRWLNKVHIKISPTGPPLGQREMKLTTQLNMLNVNTLTTT